MYAGIDLGGTKIAAGLVDETGLKDKISLPTDVSSGASKVLSDMAAAYRALIARNGIAPEEIESIGIGIPGSVDAARGVSVYANNLPFSDTPVASEISRMTGKAAFLGNDADCAALGEVAMGAAKGCKSAFMITLGTGIGGGVIIDEKIFPGANGVTGEVGHMVIVKDGAECTCGRKGCFEAYVSLRGLIALTRGIMAEHPNSSMWAEGSDSVTARTAFAAARAGDAAGNLVVDRYVDHLACGIANVINIFQPEAVIIGGGIGNEGEFLIEKLRKRTLEEVYTPSMCRTNIVSATLGNDAGLIGAALLGRGKTV